MSTPTAAVDGYIRKNKAWAAELSALRAIVTDSPLVEEIKWRAPCYTFEGANVLFLGSAKDHCVLSFIKGALLKDPKKILIQQTENSQTVRVIRFPDVAAIEKLKPVLKAYVAEAIANEKAGLKVEFKKITEHAVPEELQKKLDEMPELNKAFKALTPGRQRGYFLQIASAKQSKTREARVEKHIPRILQGKGLDDE
ncbi:MAG: YdeI/OmpD-associated family protein [Tepidisphaeraceae bacterium]